tara:strand:- start:53 stop:382 length:330 start_codon:yes stop_codon:yes gene_type:complete
MTNSPLTEILEDDFLKFQNYYKKHLPETSLIEYKNALNFFIGYVSRIEGIEAYSQLTKGMLNSKLKAFMKKYHFHNLDGIYMQRSLRDFFWFVSTKLKKEIGKSLNYID